MLCVGVPGISWGTERRPGTDRQSDSSCHDRKQHSDYLPLSNIETLTQERVFFMSLPLNVERMEGTWVRAIAIEEVS